MSDSELRVSKTEPSKVEQLMTEIENLQEENQNLKQLNKTNPNLSDKEKELHNENHLDGMSLLPRVGPRSREEKKNSYEEEIKRIVNEMNIDQSNLEYYESQERYLSAELTKLEQANYPNPKADILKQHFLDELEQIHDEMFSKLGTAAEQTLRKKLRTVRIDNIVYQLSFLTNTNQAKRKSQEVPSPNGDRKFTDNEYSNGSFLPLNDSFAASPTPSSISLSSSCRPWLRDHPASEVSIPHFQVSSGSLPRPQAIKGKGEAFQEKFKRMQHHLLPSTAHTVPMTVKFRAHLHRRSSSVSKVDGEASPGNSTPHRPTPVCPNRSTSLTGTELTGSGARDSIGERLNASIEKGELRDTPINSSEERRQASLLSGVSDATDELFTDGLYSPARLSMTDSDSNNQDISEFTQSILAKYDMNEHESFACALQSVTHSPRHAKELFKRGVMEKSIRLLHGLDEKRRFVFHNEIRDGMMKSIYNIVQCIYSRDKLASQIFRYVTIVRNQCKRMLFDLADISSNIEQTQNELMSIRENISAGPFEHLKTFSHKPESIDYLTQFGVLYAVSEYLVVDQRIQERLTEKDEPKKMVYVKRLISGTLRNMTFLEPKNKVSICLLPEVMESLIVQLDSSNEELLNSTASLLRNLAWNAEDVSKVALNKCNAIVGLVRALTHRDIKQDSILVNITNGLVNLTQHSPENKILFCATPGAIQYMIRSLAYRSLDGNSMVIENITALFCNVSKHLANMPDHRETMQQQLALHKLVSLLTSDNDYVLMHVCGILNNLAASNPDNVNALWDLRAPQYLKQLKQSENGKVSERAGLLIKHLIILRDSMNSTGNMLNESTVQDVNLFGDEMKFNFDLEISPMLKPRFEVRKVKVKDGFHTPVKSERFHEEDPLSSNEKHSRKGREGVKRGSGIFRKLSSIVKGNDLMDKLNTNAHSQEVRFSLDTSPKRSSTDSDTRSGSQSSVKTLVSNSDPHSGQNSPLPPHFMPNHYSQSYHRVVHANEVIPHYPYSNSYQSYPHHLIDMPPQPALYPGIAHSPHIGYMHHYMPNYHQQPQRYYTPHGSPIKPTYGTPPSQPNSFTQPPMAMPYRQQPQRNFNQISRHDAAIIQARLDKQKDRSYTDSQGDLVTPL